MSCCTRAGCEENSASFSGSIVAAGACPVFPVVDGLSVEPLVGFADLVSCIESSPFAAFFFFTALREFTERERPDSFAVTSWPCKDIPIIEQNADIKYQ